VYNILKVGQNLDMKLYNYEDDFNRIRLCKMADGVVFVS